MLTKQPDFIPSVYDSAGLTPEQRPARAELITVCAWCGKTRIAASLWLNLKDDRPEHRSSNHRSHISHGICPRCSLKASPPPAS